MHIEQSYMDIFISIYTSYNYCIVLYCIVQYSTVGRLVESMHLSRRNAAACLIEITSEDGTNQNTNTDKKGNARQSQAKPPE